MNAKRSVILTIPMFLIALIVVVGFASAAPNVIPPNTDFQQTTGWAYPVYSAPTLTLNGNSVVNVLEGTTYVDLGATAWDSHDGDLSGYITVVNRVDTSTPGTYTVTYWVTNFGGITTNATRTVNVVTSMPQNQNSSSSLNSSAGDTSLTAPQSALGQASQTSPLLPSTGQAISTPSSVSGPLSTWEVIGIIALALIIIIAIFSSRAKKKEKSE
jgi:Domain of unknown function (DUF5011)